MNPWNPSLSGCVIRVGPGGKCGGILEAVKSAGPIKPKMVGEFASPDEKNELDAFLSKTDLLGEK